jgi:CRP-like cAMP-binding protein
VATRRIAHEPSSVIYAQGESATTVMFVETGTVRLSIIVEVREILFVFVMMLVVVIGFVLGN